MRRQGRCLALLGLWLALCAPALADHGIVHLDAQPDRVPLTDGLLAALPDPAGTLTLEQVRAADAAGQFAELPGNLGQGYTREVWWLRFRVTLGDDDRRYWLEILPPFLDDVRYFLVRPDGTVDAHRDGDHQPRSQRVMDHRTLLFRIDAPPGDSTVYLRIETTSSMLAALTIWRGTSLFESAIGQYLLYGLYFGLVIAVFALVAINWLLLRDRLFVIYLGYIGTQLLYGVTSSGIGGQYLFPENSPLPDLLVGVSVSLAVAFGMAFFTRILEFGNDHRWLDRLFMGVAAVACATAISAVTGHYGLLIPWLQGLVALSVAASLPVALPRTLSGPATRRLAAVAFVPYALLVAVSSLTYLGVFPASPTAMFSSQAGNLVHLFILHAAMVMRTRDAEQSREQLAGQAQSARAEAAQERQRRDEHAQFLSMIAHEIRTPVAIIDAATESLRLVDETPPPERGQRYDRIQRATRRLDHLLELALLRVQPQNDEADEPPAFCDLNALTRDVVRGYEPQHDQQINVWMATDQACVQGQPDLLRFVLVNLLDNACKYSPALSVIDIEVRPERRDRIDGWAWTIRDQGMGVASDQREQIFGKYVRGGEQHGTAGLGLGLYVSREVVARAGGTLRCDEPAGPGASFTCWLPRAHAPGSIPASTPAEH